MKRIITCLAVLLSIVCLPLRADEASEKVALETFKKDITAVATWIEEKQKNPPADPAVGMAMMGEIIGKFKTIKTDGLPADLKATWGEFSGVLGELGELFKGIQPTDKDKPEDALKILGELMPKIMKVQERMEPISVKLDELGKKYGLDFDKIKPGGGKPKPAPAPAPAPEK